MEFAKTAQMYTPFVPKQMKNNNAWATGVFKTWISTRNSTLPGAETIPKGNFTNHSLCATGTTTLFDAGIPEAVIQKRTGHRSLEALRTYERVTPAQEKVVAGVLAPVVPVTTAVTLATSSTSTCTPSPSTDEMFLDNLPAEFFD